jgi:hypothetical protein
MMFSERKKIRKKENLRRLNESPTPEIERKKKQNKINGLYDTICSSSIRFDNRPPTAMPPR